MKSNKLAPKKNMAQAMVEFAIVLPILLLLLYGILEAGRLLFMYSSIVTASRQAARYGSATGMGADFSAAGGPSNTGTPRYQDCAGIKWSAERADYLNAIKNIAITYDNGEGVVIPSTESDSECVGDTDAGVIPSDDNITRINVEVTGRFEAIVPKIVPFMSRDIKASSARTILMSVSIEVPIPGGGAAPEVPAITILDDPSPSEVGELVPVKVTVSGSAGTPEGKVTISFDGTPIPGCVNESLSGGEFICNIRFFITGDLVVEFTPADSAIYDSADSDPKEHLVEAATVVVTASDEPPLSIPGTPVTVTAKVRNSFDLDGTYVIPAGSVTFTNDEGLTCTAALDTNGYASCELVFTADGNYTAVYTSNDGIHEGGSGMDDHQVSIYTATSTPTREPTATSTATIPPTATLAPTDTPTPTTIPTDVPYCNEIRDYFEALPKTPYALVIPGDTTMYLDIPNPNTYSVEIDHIVVGWYGDKGHQVKPGKTEELRLMSVSLNGIIWDIAAPGQAGSSLTITAPFDIPAVIPPGGARLTFTFDKTYNNPMNNSQEKVTVYFSTPGCEDYPFTVTR